MTDVGLKRLTVLPSLRELTMGGNELGGAGLQALRRAHLTRIDTKESPRTPVGLYLHDGGSRRRQTGEVSTLSVAEKWLDQMKKLDNLEEPKVQRLQTH
jgi:hypothetical protein